MTTVRATIHAGVCGFVTEVTAATGDEQFVHFSIHSPCANLQGLAASLPAQVDAYQEIGDGYDGAFWTAVRGALRGCCSGCVVPAAIFKAMQVAASIALPADASLSFHPKEQG